MFTWLSRLWLWMSKPHVFFQPGDIETINRQVVSYLNQTRSSSFDYKAVTVIYHTQSYIKDIAKRTGVTGCADGRELTFVPSRVILLSERRRSLLAHGLAHIYGCNELWANAVEEKFV